MKLIAKPSIQLIGLILAGLSLLFVFLTFFMDFFFWEPKGYLSISAFIGSFDAVYIPFLILLLFPFLYIALFVLRVVFEKLGLLNQPIFFHSILIASRIIMVIGIVMVIGLLILFFISRFQIEVAFVQFLALVLIIVTILSIKYINHQQKKIDTPYIKILGLHIKILLLSWFWSLVLLMITTHYTSAIIPETQHVLFSLHPAFGMELFSLVSFIGLLAGILEFLSFSLRFQDTKKVSTS